MYRSNASTAPRFTTVRLSNPDGSPKLSKGLQVLQLIAFIDRKRSRFNFTDPALLQKKQEELTQQAAVTLQSRALRTVSTWLSEQQLRDAEAIFNEFGSRPHSPLDYARAGLNQLGDGTEVLTKDALTTYESYMRTELQLEERTVLSNLNTVRNLLKATKAEKLSQLTTENINLFCLSETGQRGEPVTLQTKVGTASRVRAFINYLLARKLLRQNPFQLEIKTLSMKAKRQRERPRILTPAQCAALLDAAIEVEPRMVPFVLLTTWTFVRVAEAKTLEPEDLLLTNARPVLSLTARKVGTKAQRTVDLPANIIPLLKECLAAGLWPKGEKLYFSHAFFQSIREKAGLIKLSERHEHGWRAVIDECGWQPHIQRHTGISYHYNLHGDIISTTRQAGNCPATAFDHYIHLCAEGDQTKFYAISRTLKKDVAQSERNALASA